MYMAFPTWFYGASTAKAAFYAPPIARTAQSEAWRANLVETNRLTDIPLSIVACNIILVWLYEAA